MGSEVECTRKGSNNCTCPIGYQQHNDSRRCIDIDECAQNTDGCSHGCINIIGSYYCICPSGHEITNDNATCVVIDESGKNIDSYSHEVDCIRKGSNNCTCPIGYELLRNDSRTCFDIDECAQSVCIHGCINRLGSYYCTCPSGHELTYDNRTCIGELYKPQLCM
jgi:fibulin 1/2